MIAIVIVAIRRRMHAVAIPEELEWDEADVEQNALGGVKITRIDGVDPTSYRGHGLKN